jgi:hypothetical protein
VLSDEFYQEIISHPIPADLEAVKILSGSPAVLDLFVWLSYRCFVAKGPESIPLFGEFGLANQLGSVEYSRPRRFRQMLAQWLRKIRAIWPECPARISSDGGSLPSTTPRPFRHQAAHSRKPSSPADMGDGLTANDRRRKPSVLNHFGIRERHSRA